MPHPCANDWTHETLVNRVTRLADMVEKEIDRQAQAGCASGGWAYWLATLQDFNRFRDAYMEVCRALNATTVLPGEWAPMIVPPPLPPENMAPINPLVSQKIANASQGVLDVLEVDETELDATGQPIHPGMGTHGWLGSGPIDPDGYADVERLFTGMRNALDR